MKLKFMKLGLLISCLVLVNACFGGEDILTPVVFELNHDGSIEIFNKDVMIVKLKNVELLKQPSNVPDLVVKSIVVNFPKSSQTATQMEHSSEFKQICDYCRKTGLKLASVSADTGGLSKVVISIPKDLLLK